MPAWNDLLSEFTALEADERSGWVASRLQTTLAQVGELRGDRHVLLYGSAFLQKPEVPAHRLMIQNEDLNGFMGVVHGMDWARGMTLLLHTPGGSPNAAESIVSYLRTKFDDLEVIVPTFAMSAGTMVALAAQQIVMARHSQLGPIDPQFVYGGRSMSARAVVDQFEEAEREILKNTVQAHVWAPILQSLGPALLQEARNALAYSERMVAGWLEQYMLRGREDASGVAKAAAAHFNDASTHKSHGRRIGREEARDQGLEIVDLESDQDLQEAVLTAYHVMTIAFEQGPIVKLLTSDTNRSWVKNYLTTEQQKAQAASEQAQPGNGPRPNRADRRKGKGGKRK